MTVQTEQLLERSALGSCSVYASRYSPDLLFAIPRLPKRLLLGIDGKLPFVGDDIWNAYELSWLNAKGKPVVAIARVCIPADSRCIVESKSVKLYFNSLNDTVFTSSAQVENTIAADLTCACEAVVTVQLQSLPLRTQPSIAGLSDSECLDELDVLIERYTVSPQYLTTSSEVVTECLHTHLFKALCLCTGQPDWGSVQVVYHGNKINHAGLLKYLISYRQHQGFAEHCVEQIYVDIMQYCQPQKLAVSAYFTRRGGIDINPVRSSCSSFFVSFKQRLARQ